MKRTFAAGAATAEITPQDSQFLYGYPHVERFSTGVHDALLSSALHLSDGQTEVLFIANDVIYIPKAVVRNVRRRIAGATSVPADHIMVAATHTHSGPMTVDCLISEADPVVPETDPDYVRFMEERIVAAGIRAHQSARPAEVGLAVADGSGVGTNRRDPSGPADPNVPVLAVRSADNQSPIALMLVCSMHPTVLHEDSTLVSGDFPAMARQYLQQTVLGPHCPILHHTGPCGNQSPRHRTKANTFAEAQRLGRTLGRAVEAVLPGIQFDDTFSLDSRQASVELALRTFPSVAQAEAGLAQARDRLAQLRADRAQRPVIRTAQCDWFGAEETLALARAAASGRLPSFVEACMPAEIQLIRIGPWSLVAWPGEIFVEFALQIKSRHPNTFIISLANGELQGYLVTKAAVAEGGYEASNAIFASPESGEKLVLKTLELLSS